MSQDVASASPPPASADSTTDTMTSTGDSISTPPTTTTTTTTHQPSSAGSPAAAPSTASSMLSSPPLPQGPTAAAHHHHHQPAPPAPGAPAAERQVAEARTALVASIGNMLDARLSGRAATLHANAAAIARQERDVVRATEALRRDNDRLGRVAADAARKVKELGNVQNWAEVLERDFLVLEETLRLAREGSEDGEGSWSGSGSGSYSGSWSGSEAGSVREGEHRGDDGDVMMEDEGDEGRRAEKGKGREVAGGGDRMDLDMPIPAGLSTADDRSKTSPTAKIRGGGPVLTVPAREPSDLSASSLENELRSAMDQPIGSLRSTTVDS